ncbi:polyprenol phosphomannose-dependent alpha 1,6 mannosyltransferase MptB [Saccharopolyspora montiporae]|uniref:polyprenol phosphomannose-dependent alpha 1,6 mannosyltransferase MptB n=1 Tax=Saccharopolyspora montiporae TaxID=2781240 RepID=UPI00351C41A4
MVRGDESEGARREPGADAEVSASADPPPLASSQRRMLAAVRRFGLAGSLILAVGAIGAGATPVDNPLSGARLIGLPARIPTVAMACSWLGTLMVVAGWLWLGRFCSPAGGRMITLRQLTRVGVLWSLPLALAPPLFTRDMYFYLAQGEAALQGFDPYVLGPEASLGLHNPLTRNVDILWQDTPAPYGPGFLMLARALAVLVGENVVTGVLLWRLVMLVGLGMAVWAIPRLARRCGVHPVPALWLGALNPIVLFHVVSGMHNEALLVGIMLVAIELGLRRSGWPTVVLAGVLLSLGGAIKPPGFIALGFLGVLVARRNGGRFADLVKVAVVLAVTLLATMAVVTAVSGWGLGWLDTYDVPNRIITPLAPLTTFGVAGGGLSMLLGLGDHTDAVLVITKLVGYAGSAGVCAWMLWRSFRGRIEPLAGLGITLGAVAVLGPVLHPWYLLWMLVPLALSTHDARFRIGATGCAAVVALLIPPSGGGYEDPFQIPLAVVAALLAFAALVWLTRDKVPDLLPRKGARRGS